MGRLIDRDDLLMDVDIRMLDGETTKSEVVRIIGEQPEIRAYPERRAALVRKVYNRDAVRIICSACEKTQPDYVSPCEVRFCWKCGAKIVEVRDG